MRAKRRGSSGIDADIPSKRSRGNDFGDTQATQSQFPPNRLSHANILLEPEDRAREESAQLANSLKDDAFLNDVDWGEFFEDEGVLDTRVSQSTKAAEVQNQELRLSASTPPATTTTTTTAARTSLARSHSTTSAQPTVANPNTLNRSVSSGDQRHHIHNHNPHNGGRASPVVGVNIAAPPRPSGGGGGSGTPMSAYSASTQVLSASSQGGAGIGGGTASFAGTAGAASNNSHNTSNARAGSGGRDENTDATVRELQRKVARLESDCARAEELRRKLLDKEREIGSMTMRHKHTLAEMERKLEENKVNAKALEEMKQTHEVEMTKLHMEFDAAHSELQKSSKMVVELQQQLDRATGGMGTAGDGFNASASITPVKPPSSRSPSIMGATPSIRSGRKRRRDERSPGSASKSYSSTASQNRKPKNKGKGPASGSRAVDTSDSPEPDVMGCDILVVPRGLQESGVPLHVTTTTSTVTAASAPERTPSRALVALSSALSSQTQRLCEGSATSTVAVVSHSSTTTVDQMCATVSSCIGQSPNIKILSTLLHSRGKGLYVLLQHVPIPPAELAKQNRLGQSSLLSTQESLSYTSASAPGGRDMPLAPKASATQLQERVDFAALSNQLYNAVDSVIREGAGVHTLLPILAKFVMCSANAHSTTCALDAVRTLIAHCPKARAEFVAALVASDEPHLSAVVESKRKVTKRRARMESAKLQPGLETHSPIDASIRSFPTASGSAVPSRGGDPGVSRQLFGGLNTHPGFSNSRIVVDDGAVGGGAVTASPAVHAPGGFAASFLTGGNSGNSFGQPSAPVKRGDVKTEFDLLLYVIDHFDELCRLTSVALVVDVLIIAARETPAHSMNGFLRLQYGTELADMLLHDDADTRAASLELLDCILASANVFSRVASVEGDANLLSRAARMMSAKLPFGDQEVIRIRTWVVRLFSGALGRFEYAFEEILDEEDGAVPTLVAHVVSLLSQSIAALERVDAGGRLAIRWAHLVRDGLHLLDVVCSSFAPSVLLRHLYNIKPLFLHILSRLGSAQVHEELVCVVDVAQALLALVEAANESFRAAAESFSASGVGQSQAS